MDKVLTDEEQRLIEVFCQRVGEAVTEVEPRRVAYALAESAIGFTGNRCLMSGQRFNDDAELLDLVIERCCVRRFRKPIGHDCGFKIAGRRDAVFL